MRRPLAFATTSLPALALSSLCLLVACGAPRGVTAPVPAAELDRDWLDGSSSLNANRLDRLFSLATHDPEVKPLYDEALQKLGHGSLDELRGRFSICSEGDAPGLAGKTFMREERVVIAHGDGWQAEVGPKAKSDDLMDARVVDGPDYTTVERWVIPRVCLQPALPVRAAYEALVHELTHALKRDPRVQPFDLASATDEGKYAQAVVSLPGDEVDAYSAASRARAKLDGNNGGLIVALQKAFDRSGRMVASRDAVGRIVLARPPEGLGYGDNLLRGALQKSRTTEATAVDSKRRLLAGYADLRHAEQGQLAKNVDIIAGNAQIREKNIAIAQQRGDRALEAKFRGEMDADRKQLAETKARLTASQQIEQRVRAELPVLDARIAALTAKLSAPIDGKLRQCGMATPGAPCWAK